MINPGFQGVNRIFVLSFENKEDRTVHTKYYLSTMEIKNFNVVMLEKTFDQPVKNNLKTYDIRKIATDPGGD